MEKDEETLEKEHFFRILNAFKYYRTYSLRRVENAEKNYRQLPQEHQKMISHFVNHLNTVRACIDHNYEIIKLIIKDTENIFENKNHTEMQNGEPIKPVPPTGFDMDKVKTTLKQFVRDWSELGKEERRCCYEPVINEILKRFPPHLCNPGDVTVLVPGAGLGRLAFELAKLGYSCQGNEWSLFMLFASNFVLNKCKDRNCFRLYPWVHQWTNNESNSDQVEAVTFPDINPSELPENSNFSMAAGDFLEVYKDPGPLLYHYADIPNEMSIELSYEDVKNIIKQAGFVYEKEETKIKTTYTQNPKSMLNYEYNSLFFVVRKPA
ncbi:hypothetical protein CHS0354_037241 [Potamilus streckersoni]|uniref:carnosine N-methyltransferase n=1 Tax=Potamilus streckersoni TaxID=2493646 RepID=A0AAE0W4A8_9BIVA|nr:hypothetical protein CHS0354_037241 [Potamilus streckersoni]